ncbi:Serine/threonine-protein kinase pkn1 [Maioricimonas rarisocia]|uniref:Serine/threonine-protein kinase pkn1 n=2 Tax=Maioricimonas rarisocia TaxID=2528026 RepID=A0A517Z1P3_9PLAN|nr:Serine/threonine-protein kinase pkn1 [Maioricimonas rarisocia]
MSNRAFTSCMPRVLAVLTASACLLASATLSVAEEVPGLVKTRPSEGRYVETDQGFMVPYSVTIPGTELSFRMVPVPGGTYQMGSSEDEPGHKEDEGPQIPVQVEPFWMAEREVNWAEYREFMKLYVVFKRFEQQKLRAVTEENRVDAITAPTQLYEPSFTFEFGDDDNLPAVTMTQYAAKQYSKWLSKVTGLQLRLPSDAEWEYACRAGSQTAYFFGDDPAELDEYAWYAETTNLEEIKPVATKKPNPWGLYDMHGSVAEWVIDEYREDGYAWLAEKAKNGPIPASEAIAWPTEEYPRTVRGGSWEMDAEECRCASKLGSNVPDWKAEDPNLPLSPWWFTSDPARGVGFRLVRPLKEMPREEIARFWEIDSEDVQYDVDVRLQEGRGVLGIVDETLPQAIEELGVDE